MDIQLKHWLVLAASPRPLGNSERAAELAAATLRGKGLAADVILLRKHAVAPCTACGLCSLMPGACSLDPDRTGKPDDAAAIFARMREAEGLIVIAPVYFYGLPAPFKALVDRAQRYWMADDESQADGMGETGGTSSALSASVPSFAVSSFAQSASAGSFAQPASADSRTTPFSSIPSPPTHFSAAGKPALKPACAILPAGRVKGERLFDGSLLSLRPFLRVLGFSLNSHLPLRGLDAANALASRPDQHALIQDFVLRLTAS